MEKSMLSVLQWNLTLPTLHNFLARFRKAAGIFKDDIKVSMQMLGSTTDTVMLRSFVIHAFAGLVLASSSEPQPATVGVGLAARA